MEDTRLRNGKKRTSLSLRKISVRAILIGLLSISFLASLSCSLREANNPFNPSYRVVTKQVMAIESSMGVGMGMRGGLSAMLRAGQLNWPQIMQKIADVEEAWPDVRLELERRAERQAGINDVIASFQRSIASFKADVSAKDKTQASASFAKLSKAFQQAKDVLYNPEINSWRLVTAIGGFLVALLVLTVISGLIAKWRDPAFILQPPADKLS